MARRQERLNNRLMEVLTPVIETEMSNPRLQMLNLTRVKMNRDGSHATIYFVSENEDYSHKEVEIALNKAKGYFRSVLAEALNLRYTPDLSFRYDQSIEESKRLDALFEQIAAERVNNPPRFDEEST